MIAVTSEAEVLQEIDRGHASGGQWLVLGEPAYPLGLAQCDSAPPVIWVKGPT